MSTHKFFNILFNGHDHIVAGDRYSSKPELMGNVVENSIHAGYQLFTVNPIHPGIDFGHSFNPEKYEINKPRRADINCSSLRNFIFEIDGIALDDQLELLFRTGIPWTSIVYSGNKSYHAILSLERDIGQPHTEHGIQQYKQVWKRIAAYINSVYAPGVLSLQDGVIDSCTGNPSRFTRFPNSMRQGYRQRIEFQGTRCSDENFTKILKKCPLIKAPEVNFVDVANYAKNEKQFWALCCKGLANWIKYPEEWAKSKNNYPRLRDIAYWSKREVTKDGKLLLDILEEHTFPVLRQFGYPQHKISNVKDIIIKIFRET